MATSQEDTMRRILIIRRRRYLARAVTLGLAAALLLPAAALAGYDEHGAGTAVDPYAASGLSAEDVHGGSAVNSTVVLPEADRKAVEQAAKPAAAPRVVSQPSVAPSGSVDWLAVSLYSALGLAGLAGLFVLARFAGRRTTRIAHS
jgi:hypothetical protein